MILPKMVTVQQKLHSEKLKDIPEKVAFELNRLKICAKIKKGDTVAVTVGSRGIHNIDVIAKAVVDTLKGMGAEPFIIPAMGSHGGATERGQAEVLNHYGVSEELIGVPVKASMEVVEIGETPDGIPVYIDKYAHEADYIVPLNRIKPHTDFKGDLESGLMKIMTIGLGKHKGAQLYHQAAIEYGLEHMIETVGRTVLKNAPILCGVGIIENGYCETAIIEAVMPEDLEKRERALLLKAKEFLAKLPFEDVDVLIIDYIGKNISGTGMDSNVVGRFYSPLLSKEPEKPKIKRILVCDITPESDGNALGIGIADFCSQRTLDKMDIGISNVNALTGMCPEKVRIPMSFNSDKEMLEAALKTIGLPEPENAKVIHIYSTLHLEQVEISEAYFEEAVRRDDLKILSERRPVGFDDKEYITAVAFKSGT